MNYHIIAAAALSLVLLATLLYYTFYHSSSESKHYEGGCCTTLSKQPTRHKLLVDNLDIFLNLDDTSQDRLAIWQKILNSSMNREAFMIFKGADFIPLNSERLAKIHPESSRLEEIFKENPVVGPQAIKASANN